MTSDEVAEPVWDGRVATVPNGLLETRDRQLPIDTDTKLTEAVVSRVSRARPELITAYPPVHYVELRWDPSARPVGGST